MTNYVKTTLVILFGAFLVSCSSTTIEEPIIIENPDVLTTYDKDVQSIISGSCATTACHGSTTPPGGISLNTYDQVKTVAESGRMVARMNNSSNPMPPSGMLDQTLRTIIDQWVADGLLEN